MKKISIFLAVVVLLLASLACQTVMGGADTDIPIDDGGVEAPTLPPVDSDGGDFTIGGGSDFPLPADATNVIDMGNDVLNFQTKLSLDDAMGFYRDEFGKSGYTERAPLTEAAAGTFSMVFDGHASGKPITVQGVDLGDGTVNISITLADF